MATIAEALAIAFKHHERGELPQAQRIYRQIVEAEPDHAEAWHLLGLVEHQTGRAERAVEAISRAVAIDASKPTYFNHLGAAHAALGQMDEAEDAFRRALALDADNSQSHYNLAALLNLRKRPDEAIESYRRAVELARLLEETARVKRALLIGGRRRLGVGGGEGDVLHEVLLVGLGRLQEVPLLLEGLGGAKGIAALHVEVGRLVPLPGHPEEPGRLEVVALLPEEGRGLGRLARVHEELGGLLVVAGREIELGRALRIGTTGHVLEWLALALSDEELREPWVQQAASALSLLILDSGNRPIDSGGLYHATHGLHIYHTRVFGRSSVTSESLLIPRGTD